MKTILSLLVAFAFALTAQAGSGNSGKVADVSLESLKQAIAEGSITLIDVNGSKSYQKGHIPGALDFQEVSADLASVLPADKDALVVAYCANTHCGAYKRAVSAAVALGYTNVAHFSGGIEGWKNAGEAVEEG
ncbi:MAG: rhodanese-like domain-containing protein [Opitutaceae bacterium]